MKFNSLLIFPVALIIIIAITVKPRTSAYEWQPTISYATLHDSLPYFFLEQVKPHEIQGLRLSRNILENTFYFEYTADHKQLLKSLANLPFAADSLRADVQCRIVDTESELKRVNDILRDPLIARVFDQPDSFSNYTVYECLKSPQHHYVLLSKGSNEVIHIIQQV